MTLNVRKHRTLHDLNENTNAECPAKVNVDNYLFFYENDLYTHTGPFCTFVCFQEVHIHTHLLLFILIFKVFFPSQST